MKIRYLIVLLSIILVQLFIISCAGDPTTALEVDDEATTLDPVIYIEAIGGINNDYFYGTAATSDGGAVMVGKTNSDGEGDYDGYIVKVNSQGAILWAKSIGGGNTDVFEAVIETSDGGYVAVGNTNSDGAGQVDAFVVKVSSSGSIVWDRTIGGNVSNEYFKAVMESSDGGIVAVGDTDSSGVNYDGFVVKLNSSGIILWDRTIGSGDTDVDTFNAVAEGDSQDVIAAGYTRNSDIIGDPAAYVVKMDWQGNILWDMSYGGVGNDLIYSVAYLSDGNIMAVGSTVSDGAGGFDGLIYKINYATGAIIWDKTIGGTDSEHLYSVIQTSDGNIVIGGYSASDGAGGGEAFIFKMDTSGVVIWDRTVGESVFEEFKQVVEASNGDLICAGYTTSTGAGNQDGFIARLDSGGELNGGTSTWVSSAPDSDTVENADDADTEDDINNVQANADNADTEADADDADTIADATNANTLEIIYSP